MLTVLSGSENDLFLHCHELQAASDKALFLSTAKTNNGRNYVRHNANLRDLLAQLRPALGSEKFEEIVMRHRVAASFLLDKIYESLTPTEKNVYAGLATRLTSHTSHNWFTVSFLVTAWQRLFSELLSQKEILVIVPDLQGMDPTFIDVLRKILVEGSPREIEVIVGFPRERREFLLDDRGILWDAPTFRNLRESFATFEDAAVCDIPSRGITFTIGHEFSPKTDDWDGDTDTRIFQALGEASSDAQLLQVTCAVLERVFSAYGFRSALQLGLKLADSEEYLTDSQKSLVHATVAICAHNRQFSSFRGSESFNMFLEAHFSKALELERDPIKRSAISYRFATTLARRRKNADLAIACVDRSLDELRSTLPASRVRAYHEAWLLNIRAYAYMLLKNNLQSARDVEDAFMLAEEFWNDSEDATPDEIYSAQLFAGNRATLAMYGRDEDALKTWFGKGTGLFESRWDVGKRYVRFLKVIIARKNFDMRLAVEAACEGLADAVRERSADYQDLYRMNLADLYFRLGELDQAFACLDEAVAMYDKLKEPRRKLVAVLLSATAQMRAGNLCVANTLYRDAMKSAKDLGSAAAIDILSVRAILALRLGDLQEAQELLDEAIERALASAERDLLLLVARRSGDSFLEVKDYTQARDAYLRAAEIAMAAPEGSTPRAPAGEMARIWLGLLECDGSSEYLYKLLDDLAAALEDDADLWWELPRILSLVLPMNLEEKRSEVEILLRASSQRRDCQALLRHLLPPGRPPENRQFSPLSSP